MCAHWQSEYDASPCSYCESDKKAWAAARMLRKAVETVIAKTGWSGDDVREYLAEALREADEQT